MLFPSDYIIWMLPSRTNHRLREYYFSLQSDSKLKWIISYGCNQRNDIVNRHISWIIRSIGLFMMMKYIFTWNKLLYFMMSNLQQSFQSSLITHRDINSYVIFLKTIKKNSWDLLARLVTWGRIWISSSTTAQGRVMVRSHHVSSEEKVWAQDCLLRRLERVGSSKDSAGRVVMLLQLITPVRRRAKSNSVHTLYKHDEV